MEPTPYITRGSADFCRVALAMIAAGFSTLALMNCVQPLMPVLSSTMGLSASATSLSMSLNIGALALALPVAGAVSEAVGRKNVMAASLFLSALLMMISAFSASWHALLAYRVAQGIVFSGVPAVAMAYMGEEIDPRQRGLAVGLYVSGGAFGGMAGRVMAGFLVDHAGWRVALFGIGTLGMLTAILFLWLLPPSRHFHRQPIKPGSLLANYRLHLADGQQRLLYTLGFLFMGCLVSTYNYLGYRLVDEPFMLSHTLVGLLFVVYLVGIASSTVAGGLADTYGRKPVLVLSISITLLGMLVMAADQIVAVVAGVVIFTGGFFAAHSVTSGWVGANAPTAKAQASALYLFCYYIGGALFGWIGGYFWETMFWPGVTLMACLMLSCSLLIACAFLSNNPRC